MNLRALPLVLLCAVLGTALVAGAASAGHKSKHKQQAHKVSVCHKTGKGKKGTGTYHLIRISKRALPAHLRHGDARPGDTVNGRTLGSDCSFQPQRFTSGQLAFGPMGWAGWSCPLDMVAVGGGTSLTTVNAQGVAQPGATIGGFTYPTFPHYTFASGETGFVVQNDNDTEVGTIFVDCVPK